MSSRTDQRIRAIVQWVSYGGGGLGFPPPSPSIIFRVDVIFFKANCQPWGLPQTSEFPGGAYPHTPLGGVALHTSFLLPQLRNSVRNPGPNLNHFFVTAHFDNHTLQYRSAVHSLVPRLAPETSISRGEGPHSSCVCRGEGPHSSCVCRGEGPHSSCVCRGEGPHSSCVCPWVSIWGSPPTG